MNLTKLYTIRKNNLRRSNGHTSLGTAENVIRHFWTIRKKWSNVLQRFDIVFYPSVPLSVLTHKTRVQCCLADFKPCSNLSYFSEKSIVFSLWLIFLRLFGDLQRRLWKNRCIVCHWLRLESSEETGIISKHPYESALKQTVWWAYLLLFRWFQRIWASLTW